MDKSQIETELDKRKPADKMGLLLKYGHQLTIMCREAYEFQAPGVTNPRLLRDANEIHHRIYQAVRELTLGDEKGFSLTGISHWIAANERSEDIKKASIQAFKRAMEKCNT